MRCTLALEMGSTPTHCLRLMLALSLALVRPGTASAFTLSDGSEAVCTTAQGVVREQHHPAGDPTAPAGYIGFTHLDAGGWTIDWNDFVLASAPNEVHDLVFFHECAHAKTGSLDEVQANCVGLLDMRAAGRAGRIVEARIAAYHRKLGYMGPEYGLATTFWARTVACANNRSSPRKPAAR